MSKKLLREWVSLECNPDLIKESRDKNAGKIILPAILQKAHQKNQNGRIYPRSVLEREVLNYKKIVADNRALGECVDGLTEIMTSDGWKLIKDIDENESVAILEKNEIKFETIKKKIVLPFKGNILHFYNDSNTLDMMLTPNHKVIVYDRNGKEEVVFAEELASNLKKYSHHSLRKIGGQFVGIDPEYFEMFGHKIKSDVWAAFLGFYLAEGCCNKTSASNNIFISQKKENIKNEFRNLIKDFPIKCNENEKQDGKVDFHFYNKEMKQYLLKLGLHNEKHIPEDVKCWSPRLQEILLTWMLKGDGRNRKNRNGSVMRELYTTSEKLANDVCQMFFKLNSSAGITTRIQKDRLIDGRMIEEENSKLLYIVSEHSSKTISLDDRFVKVDSVEYDGEVYCVETSTGNWLMKRNGHSCWTHNCDHPDQSTIALDRVSHIVRDIFWEGDTVRGMVEILNTPKGQILQSLLESGVKIGMSSRGVGSTEKTNEGIDMVQEDYQLICFDAVSEPSTPGAFVNESKIMDVEPRSLNKSDRIWRALNDIDFGKRK